MIFVTGYGQLCNNILQFGHYYAWGKKHGIKVIGLRFCYKYPYFRISTASGYNWFTYLFAKYGAKMGLIRRVSFQEEGSMTEANLAALRSNRLLLVDGWHLKDYDAFLERKDELKSMFSFREKIIRKMNPLLQDSPDSSTITIGLHVRRGDYSRWQEGRYYFSNAEYCAVVRSFLSSLDTNSVRLLLVSNDSSLSAEEFQQELGIKVLHLSGNPGEDLYALSTCDYLIGPPSTFSLMAAFYRDVPLYWIFNRQQAVTRASFRSFNELFKEII